MFVKMFQNGDAWFQSSRNGRWKLNPNIACSNQFGSMSTNIFSKTPPLPVACQAPLAGLEQRNPWKILPAVRHNQIGGKMLQKLCHSRARYPQFSRLVVVLVWARFYRGLVRRADLSCWHFNLGSEIWLPPLGPAAKSCGSTRGREQTQLQLFAQTTQKPRCKKSILWFLERIAPIGFHSFPLPPKAVSLAALPQFLMTSLREACKKTVFARFFLEIGGGSCWFWIVPCQNWKQYRPIGIVIYV